MEERAGVSGVVGEGRLGLEGDRDSVIYREEYLRRKGVSDYRFFSPLVEEQKMKGLSRWSLELWGKEEGEKGRKLSGDQEGPETGNENCTRIGRGRGQVHEAIRRCLRMRQ